MAKNALVVSIVGAAAAMSAFAFWALSKEEALMSIAPDADIQIETTNTVASKWQWDNFTKGASADESKADKRGSKVKVPYDAVEVYRILQTIRLDENGRLVPDQTALQALEKGFNDLGPNLSPEELAGLQELIRKGLPGHAGEEAADILENYYRYRLAEGEFNAQMVSLPSAEHYRELAQLRRNYLGPEVADKLFAVEDAQARHMIAAIAIQQDATLTAEQKQSKLESLQKQLSDRQLSSGQLKPEEVAAEKVRLMREQGASNTDIYSTRESILGAERARELATADREEQNWQSGFNGYWQARTQVMRAGLDEAERESQIERLLEQYFRPEERERAKATSLEWEVRETK